MLNEITTTNTTLSKAPLAPLFFAGTYSLSATNIKPVRTNTNLNDTANPCRTLYQPHSANVIGPSAILFSSPSSVNTRNLSPVFTKDYSVPFVAMNKSVKTFDGLEHQ